ncbi:MAG: CinY protein [Pseudomonadota bacterium]
MRYLAISALALFSAGSALAFGTISPGAQTAEHERITRRALACSTSSPEFSCLGGDTLTQLAGTAGTFGAIGYPDSSTAIFKARAHCDDGDVPANLDACRDWMQTHMDAAVTRAGRLLSAQGRVDAVQASLTPGCVWTGDLSGRAKCNVLQALGIVMHASQDFYSHSNWTDSRSDTNPLGLGNTAPSPSISLRSSTPFPAAVVTGCFGVTCGARIQHAALNKDTGPIGATIGPGTTPRGNHNDNFASAVRVATADTVDKWKLFRELVVARYGAANGGRIICAMARDNATTC